MKISAINSGINFKAQEQIQSKQDRKSFHIHPLPTTGWTAAGAFGVSMISGAFHKPLLHKTAAFIGMIATAAHIGIISALHHNYKESHAKG